jgi:hypothetical protein
MNNEKMYLYKWGGNTGFQCELSANSLDEVRSNKKLREALGNNQHVIDRHPDKIEKNPNYDHTI